MMPRIFTKAQGLLKQRSLQTKRVCPFSQHGKRFKGIQEKNVALLVKTLLSKIFFLANLGINLQKLGLYILELSRPVGQNFWFEVCAKPIRGNFQESDRFVFDGGRF